METLQLIKGITATNPMIQLKFYSHHLHTAALSLQFQFNGFNCLRSLTKLQPVNDITMISSCLLIARQRVRCAILYIKSCVSNPNSYIVQRAAMFNRVSEVTAFYLVGGIVVG